MSLSTALPIGSTSQTSGTTPPSSRDSRTSENPLREVNRLCFLVETFLDSHSGFDRDDIQGWLDLLSVAMNPPEDKMEKAAMVLDRAMRNPKTLRYREFYAGSPSSEIDE
jgi:hypothetical protein